MLREKSYRMVGGVLAVVVLVAVGYFVFGTRPADVPADVNVPVAVRSDTGESGTAAVSGQEDSAGEEPVAGSAVTQENTGEQTAAAADEAEASRVAEVAEQAAADLAAEQAQADADRAALEAQAAAEKAALDRQAATEKAAGEANVAAGNAAAEQAAREAQVAADKAALLAQAAADKLALAGQAASELVARDAQVAADKAALEAQAAADQAARDAQAAAQQAVLQAQVAAAGAAAAKAEREAQLAAEKIAADEAARQAGLAEEALEIAGQVEQETPVVAENVSEEPLADEPEIAAAEPVSEEVIAALPEKDPNSVTTSIVAPSFDLVRIAPDGGSVIAGRAQPNVTVDITADGKVIGTVTANARGEFVALLTAPKSEKPLSIGLISRSETGQRTASVTNVLILSNPISEPEIGAVAEEAPIVVRETADRIEIVQPAKLPVPNQVVIDAIGYDREGAVEISGRARPRFLVRLYMNGRFVSEAEADAGGIWMITLSDVESGRYTLRIDEIGPDGKVASRAETPFQRIFPDLLPDVGDSTRRRYTVQPGNNLWTIAKNRYGFGLGYWQIFRANRELIRDPDLIYPGQIFVLPDE